MTTDHVSPVPPPPPPVGDRARAVGADPAHAWRDETDERKRAYAARHGVDVASVDGPAELDKRLEAIIGTPDFLPGRWLRRGRQAADAVARIRASGMLGSGFLVTPWLLLTNNHVLPDPATAAAATATFRYEDDEDDLRPEARRFGLVPDRCFVTSAVDDLDFTLVAVAQATDGTAPGATYGYLPARGGTGKILEGMPVNIVQHPQGRAKEVAIRNNVLLSVDDATRLTYGTDTEPGSSGSPVLNDDWELVALHHAGGAEAPGRIVGNTGIRISAIVAHVGAVAGDDPGELLADFLRIASAP
jgi:endonuclease G